MSHSLVRQLFRELQQTLFEEFSVRMQATVREAFDQAWSAALQRLDEGEKPLASQTVKPALQTLHQQTVVEKIATERPKPPSNVGNRAEWGTTKKVIQGAWAANRGVGLTPKAIAEWGAVNGQKVASSSVRTTLQKMQKAGEARRRKDKYFPHSTSAFTAGEEAPVAGPPPATEDSRLNGSQMERQMPPP